MAAGEELQINTYVTTNLLGGPHVAMDAHGNFVMTWPSRGSPDSDSSGLSGQGRCYAANGTALGDQFQINTYTTNDQGASQAAFDADGRFVVVWRSEGSSSTDTFGFSAQGQRFAPLGIIFADGFESGDISAWD